MTKKMMEEGTEKETGEKNQDAGKTE